MGRWYLGDFDLLLGAARLNLKIVDLPVALPAAHVRHDEHQPMAARLAAPADDGVRVLEGPRPAVSAPLAVRRDLDRRSSTTRHLNASAGAIHESRARAS